MTIPRSRRRSTTSSKSDPGEHEGDGIRRPLRVSKNCRVTQGDRAAGVLEGAELRSNFGPTSNQINRRSKSLALQGFWKMAFCSKAKRPAESAVKEVAKATSLTSGGDGIRRPLLRASPAKGPDGERKKAAAHRNGCAAQGCLFGWVEYTGSGGKSLSNPVEGIAYSKIFFRSSARMRFSRRLICTWEVPRSFAVACWVSPWV